MPYEITPSKDGLHSLIYRDNSTEIRVHSAYAPGTEAERAVAPFNSSEGRIILACGLGLGYHIQSLKKKFPGEQILIFERDPELIKECRRLYPQTLSGVSVISSSDELDFVFENFSINSFKGFSVFINRGSYSIDKTFYDTLIAETNRFVSSKISDLLTRFEFEERWVENIIQNSMQLSCSLRAASFFGAFSGVPGIIVSAGPSLRYQLDFIRSASEHCLIVCVDTAFPVLCRSGIKPHFVVTLDAQKHSIKHFIGFHSPETILLSDIVASPDIVSRYEGTKALSTTSKFYTDGDGNYKREMTPFADMVEKYCGVIGDIQSGGSVATTAFDFLLNAGCSSIILTGQDLAYTGREIHSSGTHHNDNWLTMINRLQNLDTINQNIIRKRKIKHIPSTSGGTVISDYVMNLYREWFSDACGRVPIPVINLRSAGALIDGAKIQSAADLAGSISQSARKPAALIAKILSEASSVNTEELRKYYQSSLERLKSIPEMIKKSSDEYVESILKDPDLSPLLSSYTKKSVAYITRHQEITPEKRRELLSTDINRASARLSRILKKTLSR